MKETSEQTIDKIIFDVMELDFHYPISEANIIQACKLYHEARLKIEAPTDEEIAKIADSFIELYPAVENNEVSWQTAEDCFVKGFKKAVKLLTGI